MAFLLDVHEEMWRISGIVHNVEMTGRCDLQAML
jgi:hypothetical protein